MPKQNWIDFKKVREGASFEAVLAHYGLELERKGAELVGLCPFHEDTRPSFRINPKRKIWKCFSGACEGNSGGNILDFVALKERCSIRRAAEFVAEWSGMGEEARTPPPARERPPQPRRKANPLPDPTGGGEDRPPPDRSRAARPTGQGQEGPHDPDRRARGVVDREVRGRGAPEPRGRARRPCRGRASTRGTSHPPPSAQRWAAVNPWENSSPCTGTFRPRAAAGARLGPRRRPTSRPSRGPRPGRPRPATSQARSARSGRRSRPAWRPP